MGKVSMCVLVVCFSTCGSSRGVVISLLGWLGYLCKLLM